MIGTEQNITVLNQTELNGRNVNILVITITLTEIRRLLLSYLIIQYDVTSAVLLPSLQNKIWLAVAFLHFYMSFLQDINFSILLSEPPRALNFIKLKSNSSYFTNNLNLKLELYKKKDKKNKREIKIRKKNKNKYENYFWIGN